MSEEKRISPALIIPIGLGLGLAAALGIAAVAWAAPPKPPEPEPGLANLYGTVINAATGAPVAGVLVTLDSYSTYTDTDAKGYYQLLNIEPGSYIAEFSKEGYETAIY